MIEIENTGKKYKRMVSDTILKKYIMFYDKNNNVLIYKNNDRIIFPGIYISNEEEWLSYVNSIVNCSLNFEKIEPLIKMTDYIMRYDKLNFTLIKKYLRKIKEYSSYLVDDELTKENIKLIIDKEEYEAQVMNIEQLILCLEPNQFQNYQKYASQALLQRIKER